MSLKQHRVKRIVQFSANPVSGSMERGLYESVSFERFQLRLFGTFGGLGLFLASVGIYGVMSYLVAQRTHEIGVRVALGAGRGDVLWLVIRRGLNTTLVGSILGIAGSLALTRVIAQQLYGVKTTDPHLFDRFAGVSCRGFGRVLSACSPSHKDRSIGSTSVRMTFPAHVHRRRGAPDCEVRGGSDGRAIQVIIVPTLRTPALKDYQVIAMPEELPTRPALNVDQLKMEHIKWIHGKAASSIMQRLPAAEGFDGRTAWSTVFSGSWNSSFKNCLRFDHRHRDAA